MLNWGKRATVELISWIVHRGYRKDQETPDSQSHALLSKGRTYATLQTRRSCKQYLNIQSLPNREHSPSPSGYYCLGKQSLFTV